MKNMKWTVRDKHGQIFAQGGRDYHCKRDAITKYLEQWPPGFSPALPIKEGWPVSYGRPTWDLLDWLGFKIRKEMVK